MASRHKLDRLWSVNHKVHAGCCTAVVNLTECLRWLNERGRCRWKLLYNSYLSIFTILNGIVYIISLIIDFQKAMSYCLYFDIDFCCASMCSYDELTLWLWELQNLGQMMWLIAHWSWNGVFWKEKILIISLLWASKYSEYCELLFWRNMLFWRSMDTVKVKNLSLRDIIMQMKTFKTLRMFLQ